MDGRRREAIEAVNASLRERNHAISHRDDLFDDEDREAWERCEEFVEAFAGSRAARDFESGFANELTAQFDCERREEFELKQADERIAERLAALSAARAAIQHANTRSSGELRAAVTVAFADYKQALSNKRVLLTSFRSERSRVTRTAKPYVFNHKHYLGRAIRYSDPPVRLSASRIFLEIANAYFGEAAKLRIPVLWRVCPVPPGVPLPRRCGSQRWHRDQIDRILKLFIYYTDVDEGNGALEYIPNSGPVESKWSGPIPFSEARYPGDDVIERLVPPDEIVKCCGRKGTLVFVDTAGLHRGGYATTGPRVTSQATFLRQAPNCPASPLLRPGAADASLTPEQVFALS